MPEGAERIDSFPGWPNVAFAPVGAVSGRLVAVVDGATLFCFNPLFPKDGFQQSAVLEGQWPGQSAQSSVVWRGSTLVVTEGRLGGAQHMRQQDTEDKDWSTWGQEVAAFRFLHPVDCEGNRNADGDGKGGGKGGGKVRAYMKRTPPISSSFAFSRCEVSKGGSERETGLRSGPYVYVPYHRVGLYVLEYVCTAARIHVPIWSISCACMYVCWYACNVRLVKHTLLPDDMVHTYGPDRNPERKEGIGEFKWAPLPAEGGWVWVND